MGSWALDSTQWLSVKEETIFLHDGLMRVTDVAELPSELGVCEQGDTEQEILTFESKSPVELAERLRIVCGKQSNAYAHLLKYRLNALRGLWGAQRQVAMEEQQERDGATAGVGSGVGTDEETLSLLKRQGFLQQHYQQSHYHPALQSSSDQAPFTSRVGLLLIFPLLQSQTHHDPALAGVTAEVLLACLRDCQPLSLGKEPADCLGGLEGLLCSWLEQGGEHAGVPQEKLLPTQRQRQNAAAALVALACARGSLKTFIHTVYLLQKQTDLKQLPVADVLYRLLLLEGGPGSPSCLLGGKHNVSWGFEDMLPTPDSSVAETENKDTDFGRCLATDGLYLYTTNSFGRGLTKLGSGLHGTLRGFIYCRNEELDAGWVVHSSGYLLHRPASFDTKSHLLCQVIDPYTLQVCQVVAMPPHHIGVGSSLTTLHVCSDGSYFYWIWSPFSFNEKTQKGHSVLMDFFQLATESGLCVAHADRERVILSRKEGESSKCINELLMNRMFRFRTSHSATLAALTGSTVINPVKEEQTVNASCGLPLKTLRKTPMYVCGTYLVMLSSPPNVAGSSATRSLFGGSSGLSSLKILASNLVFNLSDGQFVSRVDLIDAHGSSLGRGTPVAGLGACYDVLNNLIWTCSSDYMDQWSNPGNQAFHHVCKRLGISHVIREPKEEMVEMNEVISQLLHHVGAMCIHQQNQLASSGTSHPTSFLSKQQLMETCHFIAICDIMEKAMVTSDICRIRCILVVFQVVFRFFNLQSEQNRESIKRSGLLLWQLLMAPIDHIGAEVQREVCLAISFGLNILYQGELELYDLLKLVVTEGERNIGLSQLRDIILNNLADQLQKNRFGSEDDDRYRLNDELLQCILKTAVRESCLLITKCQTLDKEEFQKLLSAVPVASPSLKYIMAVQNHLLSNTVLISPDDSEDSDNSIQEETMKEMQNSILSLACKILIGCDEVLETLHHVTMSLINSDITDQESRLKGLEQVIKATMLGHLLPVVLTSLMHPNLQTLFLADALTPQLVQLVLYTSQTALLLKTQSPLFEDSSLRRDLLNQSAKMTCNDDSFQNLDEREEPGFLTGLKIPAPWAAGKTVETIHPVRDNYKFKETVQIPGARCLYLRFDPCCSSQYDYDKLVIYAGSNTNSRKVAEYGGNTMGYGSRSVLGTGWPKDFVKESSEDISGGLPFLADLALGLSVLACSMLRILYNGPEITQEEEVCQNLLCSKLLQRCQWQVETNGAISPALTPSPSPLPVTIDEDQEFTYPTDVLNPSGSFIPGVCCDLPRIRLPPGIMGRLRELSGKARPQFRPSIKEVIRPDVIEEVIVSCVIKHLGLIDSLQSLVNLQYREEHREEYELLCKIMAETFKKINAMERQLQSVAELEQKWQNEVDESHQGKLENNTPFFHDYHFFESKMKELELLCSLKEVPLDWSNSENAVIALRESFSQEVSSMPNSRCVVPLVKTKTLLKSLINRSELLLHVTISPHAGSLTTTPTSAPACKLMSDTKTDMMKQPVFLRSMSAPSDLEMIANHDLEFTHATKRRRPYHTGNRSSSFTLLQSLAAEDSSVSSRSFLAAAQTRWKRGCTRKQALIHMRELLTTAVRVGAITHLVGPVTMVLQGGPRIEELTCGGMVGQVQEAFGQTMTSLVSLCARYPIACANSICLLCTIPYTRQEINITISQEQCLVRSGLVQLMDQLCSLSSQSDSSSNEKQTRKQKVATMAWAAFQVLANRCIEWEKVEGGSSDAVHSGLARQVSSLLTNHLARATEFSGNQAAGNDALQDVLSLLNDLSRSNIGKAILSQPDCVSKLLSLLLDQRPSPKLVLIILQLCRVALPLMSVEDCGNVALPTWRYFNSAIDTEQEDASDPASCIASLLLAKLADYVVPGSQTLLSPASSEPDTRLIWPNFMGTINTDTDVGEEGQAVDGKLSIFIHKREDQSSHEVLQPLLSSSEGRPFRLGTGANMDRVVKMDRDLTKTGCCEVVTEEASAALRKAIKWAQSGLIVSVGPPVERLNPENSGGSTTGDKKKCPQTAVCRDRNANLSRSDPVRPFISGHVANSMAAEVIALLHSLITESTTAQIWTTAAEKVLSRALMYIPQLGKYAESILESGSSSGRKLAKLQAISRQAVAALCALGGFKETIKIGSEVQVLGRGLQGNFGLVMSINEQEGIATVKFPNIDYHRDCKASEILTVPISRLLTLRSEALPLYKLSITDKVVQAVQSMLLPREGSLSIHTCLPASGDGSSPFMAVVRLLAEIRTRSCLVMAQLLDVSSFCEEFIQQCPAAVEVLNLVAQECSPGERLGVVESQCERLRMLYRDCARPPPPPLQIDSRPPKQITWCPSRVFPPVRACMFSSHLTSVTFLADPSAGVGLPRGTFIYTTSPVPIQAPSFYWELEIVSYGDYEDDSSPIVSFGFTTEAEKRDGAWTNPVGTCLFHNNGRAVHYNGSSLLQWKSIRLDVALLPGNIAGIGWERTEETSPPPGQASKGRVFFTYCGQRLSPYLEDVAGGMWPLVHIQKKNTKVRANFGCQSFAYAEGQAHRNAADLCLDLSEEISANFEALPFAMASDSDNDASASVASDSASHGPPCRIAAASTSQSPWETKVFPIIRRRFRNEAERKSGLDQIKGALQLGMVDIARQTVEFLYEENGGIPRDLYLPNIEDIKDEASKFTTDKVRKGLTVIIRCPECNNTGSSIGGTALPKFAIRGMLKTFGLYGTVLDIDTMNDLVQVETYLRSEGVLVRYWYPIEMLERPPAGSRRTAANGLVLLDSSNIQIHSSSLYKAPWARVMMYGLGHKVRRNGQLNLMETVCYPLNASPLNTGLTPPPTTNQYPSIIIPTDKVHIKLGGSPAPGLVLVLHSLPVEFPLSMAFVEQLLAWPVQDNYEHPEEELDTMPVSVLLQIVELLGAFLWTTDAAPCIKEFIFHMLAELLRKIYNLKQRKCFSDLSSSIALLLNPCLAVLMALQTELQKLYDRETQSWGLASGSNSGSSLALSSKQARFSTYFHALMEVCLTVAEVTLQLNLVSGGSAVSNLSSCSTTNLSDSSSSSSSSPGQTPQSPSLLSKRKKVKVKQDRATLTLTSAATASKKSEGVLMNVSGGKPEDMLWFHRGLTLLMIIRHLTYKDPQGLSVTKEAVADAFQALVSSTAHSRLLVLSGIPTHLEEAVVRNAIRRACNAHGGLFKDEIFIPLQAEDQKHTKKAVICSQSRGSQDGMAEKLHPGSIESLDGSGSTAPALSMTASVSFSQTSIGSLFHGVSRTASELSVDEELLAATVPQPVASTPQQTPLEHCIVSSQESLDISLCSTGNRGSLREQLDDGETDLVSDKAFLYAVTSQDTKACPIKGYAVIEVRARAKVEKIRASLFNSSDLIGLSSSEGEEGLMELTTEEILTVSSVNQSLFDTQGSSALEDYFQDKTIKGNKLVPGARDVLIDIFRSCVYSEQMPSLTPTKPLKVSDIYLTKEQINSQTPGNLLHVFFNHIRSSKKIFEGHLTQVLRKYGTVKIKQCRYNKTGKEQQQSKVVSTKRSIIKPPIKEKLVLNSVRTALCEKKPSLKPKSPEKAKPEDKDPEKLPTKKLEVSEEKYLTLEGFLKFAVDRAKQDIHSVWRAFLACGYDLHFERCSCTNVRQAHKSSRKWSLEMDVALIQYVNRLCRHLAITPARLHPHEVYLDPADTSDPRVSCLLSVPVESLRLRFALLQSLNNTLESFFLTLVELRQTKTYQNSIASLLYKAKGLIFYDTKIAIMNKVLNLTVQRTVDHAAPELTLDPLEKVGGEIRCSENTYFCQAARQLSNVPSSQLCVKLASGGDPTYAFNIRFTGEEVHGTSGSFRHFLWQVCKELQSSMLSLLMPCPSYASNRSKGKYILTSCPITYPEEQLLHFFGQLLGIAIRADVPLPLDLQGSFWKGLVGEDLDPETDLQEADLLTYNYAKKFENVTNEAELEALCTEISSQGHFDESPDSPFRPCCTFTYVTLTGEKVELCEHGHDLAVSWENKQLYAQAMRDLRLRELQNVEHMSAVRAGLGSIIPLQLLTMLSPLEMELRTCGLPYINLDFLKSHTMYQVGLMETDQHIEFFWTALEMFTQEELIKFIKFACNQERIPFTCPCKDGGPDTAHVPPYPMKIAPPDGAVGSPDNRYIRVETCMFMVKLPQYSSLEVMMEKIRYAIHYREDPLSG
ncbi:putative E3 ubiquitin-protein ligase HECTD4 [Bagarius yarrelli]|uniref:Putative E3 ubiquitin-protein ligase HECTD4 n=1 Tax=Bagarius yarrelli TaxID=175774 RepID=A0A556V5Z9_BAGYA|nr:putative E3 ubiquitin-protein ligase HECTD4 [Bagarius yarrelli]